MEDEACFNISIRGAPIPNESSVRELPAVEAEWFGRPIQIASGVLPSTSGVFFTHTLNPAAFPQPWSDKLTSYHGIRYTIVYTVNFSATPFHAGLVRASWEPVATRNGNTFDRSSTVLSYTLPGDCMNLQHFTSMCVSCPWSGNVPYQMCGANTEFASGTFRLHQIVPVVSPAGSEQPSYSIFAHLEDLHFVGPTANVWSSVQPQSGLVSTVTDTYTRGKRRTQEFVRARSMAARAKAVKGVVEDLRETKAISTVLGAASSVATFAANIPLLSTVAAPAGWMLRMAANTAARWGFSKPQANSPLTRTFFMPTAYDNNATGEDPAPNLSLFHDSSLPPMQAGGCQIDEQAFPYVCSVPGLISRFSITNQTAETNVYSILVGPSSAYWQGNSRAVVPLRERLAVLGAAPFPTFYPTPTLVASTLAAYWRGDMVYTFRFVKTKFHTGRIAIAWYSGDDQFGNASIVNVGAGSYQYPPYSQSFSADRVTIDLKECDEYTFRVPYSSLHPATNQQGFIGSLVMYVVDPIKSPATVTSGVTVVVSASMADPAFAGYTGLPFAPTGASANVLFSPQSGLDGLHASTAEPVETFNTVAKRMNYRTTVRQPYALTLPQYTPSVAAPTAVSSALVDMVDLVRSAYAYERGGMVVAARPTAGQDYIEMVPAGSSGAFIPRVTYHPLDSARVSQPTPDSVGVRAYVPRLSTTPVYKADNGGTADPAGALREPSRLPPSITVVTTAGSFGRAVADDHMFLYFLGFPGMVRGSFV